MGSPFEANYCANVLQTLALYMLVNAYLKAKYLYACYGFHNLVLFCGLAPSLRVRGGNVPAGKTIINMVNQRITQGNRG